MKTNSGLYKLVSWSIWRFFEDGGVANLGDFIETTKSVFVNLVDRGYLCENAEDKYCGTYRKKDTSKDNE